MLLGLRSEFPMHITRYYRRVVRICRTSGHSLIGISYKCRQILSRIPFSAEKELFYVILIHVYNIQQFFFRRERYMYVIGLSISGILYRWFSRMTHIVKLFRRPPETYSGKSTLIYDVSTKSKSLEK